VQQNLHTDRTFGSLPNTKVASRSRQSNSRTYQFCGLVAGGTTSRAVARSLRPSLEAFDLRPAVGFDAVEGAAEVRIVR